MNILSIDTSSSISSICLYWQGKFFNVKYKSKASNFVKHLFKKCRDLSLSLDDFDYFIIGSGPGSFTGLRISFSFIKGVICSLNKPLKTISSFCSIANKFKNKEDKILVLTDARRNLFYTGVFRVKDGKLITEKIFLSPIEDLVSLYKDYFYITYDTSVREIIKEKYPFIRIFNKNTWPSAFELIKLGEEEFKDKFVSLRRLEPLYLYSKECQVKKL